MDSETTKYYHLKIKKIGLKSILLYFESEKSIFYRVKRNNLFDAQILSMVNPSGFSLFFGKNKTKMDILEEREMKVIVTSLVQIIHV